MPKWIILSGLRAMATALTAELSELRGRDNPLLRALARTIRDLVTAIDVLVEAIGGEREVGKHPPASPMNSFLYRN
jgi:hypothetical protein